MQIICDTHVHCYNFEHMPDLLDAALTNFNQQGRHDAAVLFFTDGQRDPTWKRLWPLVQQESTVGQWRLRYSQQTGLIHANGPSGEIHLAPARQVNSAVRLEYLLLGCDADIEDGLNDETLISEYASRFAVICPWGAGKWLGQRGKLLTRLMTEYPGRLLLGDNGGRPRIWAWVPQFKQASTPPVNGSDPLPIKADINRVGAYGITLTVPSDSLTLNTIIGAIKSNQYQNYGKSLGLLAFCVAQMNTRRA